MSLDDDDENWGYGLVNKILAIQEWRPEFKPMSKSKCDNWNPSAVEVDIVGLTV